MKIKKNKELFIIGTGLVLLSLFLHYMHYLVFQDAHHTLIFLFADIAFIPMEVFFTTLVIDKILEKREKRNVLDKLRMITGIFYTEIGTELLCEFAGADRKIEEIRNITNINKTWNDEEYKKMNRNLELREYKVDISSIDIKCLKDKLNNQKEFFINLITNETLHEHELFTEMLISIIHLSEELNTRVRDDIKKYEIDHLERDMEIAYRYLVLEWSGYMRYLSENYPQLYVKALIMNPFDNRNYDERNKQHLNIK